MDDPLARRIWDAALGQLQLHVTRPNYDTWLKNTVGLDVSDGDFVVGTPSDFVSEWLITKMQPLIARTVSGLLGHPVSVRFQLLGSNGNGNGAHPTPDPLPITTTTLHPPLSAPAQSLQLNSKYTFQRFIVGDCNRMAVAAALAAAHHPGDSYNPLFIYGPPGLGKTHLLQATAHRAAALNHRVVCVTSEHFTNDFVSAIAQARGDEFRRKYRSTQLLLLDDIQFLTGKDRTQEEFLYTFNELHSSGCHIIITCNQAPAAVTGLDPRLRSRCQMGLAIDLPVPSYEVRLAILQAKAREQDVELPHDVAALLAARNPDSTRELEGSLNRTIAYARLSRSPITTALASEALQALSPAAPASPVSPHVVLETVARYFSLPLNVLSGKSRSKPIAEARHIAMYLLRNDAQLTLKEIGSLLGHRDHATVIYACQKVAAALTEPTVKHHLSEIRGQYCSFPS